MKKKRFASVFLKNSFYFFLHTAITNIGGIIFTVLIARKLGPEYFGVYTLSLSFALILMSLGELGIEEALIRFVSLNIKNSKKAKSYFIYLLKIKVIILLFLSIILAISSKYIADFYNNSNLTYAIIMASIYIFFYSMMNFLAALFYSFNNIKAYSYKELLFQIIRISLIPLVVFISINYLGSSPIILAIVASIITTIFVISYMSIKYPVFFKSDRVEIDKKGLYKFMRYLPITSFSMLFLVYSDVLILGRFVSLEYIGFYKAANSLALAITAPIAVAYVLYPMFVNLELNRLKSVLEKIIYYTFVITVPLTTGLLFTSIYFIKFLFDYSYLEANILLYSLSFLIILIPLGDIFKVLLNSKGFSNITAKTFFYAGIINLILNFILISYMIRYGSIYAALGAGISIVLSRLFVFIFLVKESKNKFGIGISMGNVMKPIISSIFMALFLILFSNWIKGSANFFLVGLEIIGGALIYFIILFILKGISKKEIVYIFITIKETIKK